MRARDREVRLGWWLVWAALLVVWGCRAAVRPDDAGLDRRGVTAASPSVAVLDAAPPAPSASAASSASPDALPPAKPRIYLAPLGSELPAEDTALVERALVAFYAVEVVTLPRVDLPDSALNSNKRRYRAEKLLDLLDRHVPKDGFRVLGLTGVDISTTKGNIADWGILGLATLDGKACVISRFRTARGTRTAEAARIRFAKTAVHEIGHTLGLEHCPHRGCLMEDARGTVFTTDREYDLCPDCRRQLKQAGYALTGPEVPIPWPKP
jgi:predicted Zn-dependent protease